MVVQENSSNMEKIFDLNPGQNYKNIFVPLYVIQIIIIVLINCIFLWTLYGKSIPDWFQFIIVPLRYSLNRNRGSSSLEKSTERTSRNNKVFIFKNKQDFTYSVQCYFALRACGDIMSALICMPIHFHISFYYNSSRQYSNVSDSFLCRKEVILWYFEEMFIYLSSFTILAIAIDRFRAIVYPFKASEKHIKWSLLTIIFAVIALPFVFLIIKIFNPISHNSYCRLNAKLFRNYLIWITTIGMIFPYTISISLYISIIHALKLSKNITKSLLHNSISNGKKNKAIRLIWQLIGAFFICYIPIFGLYFLAIARKLDLDSEKVQVIIHGVAIWFSSLRWINPLLILANNGSLRCETIRYQLGCRSINIWLINFNNTPKSISSQNYSLTPKESPV
ncbi:unnamed protein product [Gordionus sp. m RMFG-2023]